MSRIFTAVLSLRRVLVGMGKKAEPRGIVVPKKKCGIIVFHLRRSGARLKISLRGRGVSSTPSRTTMYVTENVTYFSHAAQDDSLMLQHSLREEPITATSFLLHNAFCSQDDVTFGEHAARYTSR